MLLKITENQEIKIGIKFENKGAGGHKAGADNIVLQKLAAAPVDVTAVITNPNFDTDLNGWNSPIGGGSEIKVADNRQEQTRNFYQTWNGTPSQGRMYQQISNLPSGTYKLRAMAFADQGGTMTPLSTNVSVYAQGQDVGEASSEKIRRNYVNSVDFTYYETYAYVDGTGKLEIGMRQDSPAYKWLGMDNVSLQYISTDNQEEDLLLSLLQSKWNSVVTNVNSNILNAATYENVNGTERSTLTTAIAASTTTISDYATNASTALTAYNDFIAAKTSYDNLTTAIAAAEAASVDATAAKAVRDAAATTATDAQNAATLLNNTVEVKDATTLSPVVTTFVTNGSFDTNVDGWTSTGNFQNKGLKNDTYGTLTKFWENWTPSENKAANKMYQTINNIPNGTYRLDISAFASAIDGDNSYVFANNDKTTLTDDATTGADYQVYTVVTTNTIEIGLEQTTATANHMGIDNVSLRYYGVGDVVNAAKMGAHKYDYDQAIIAANTSLSDDNYTNVTGSERVELQAEVDKTEPTTEAGYDQATLDLTTKKQTFENAKANYDALVAEIAKAKALGIPSVTANGYAATEASTAATVLTSTQNLKVAEYTFVKTNFTKDFTDHYLTTPTTNNFGSNSGEHWKDGSTIYFDSWSGSAADKELTYSITLPEGSYIIMAAGRGNVPSSLYISDGTNNEYFTMKDATGLGINTKGDASFDPDDAEGFANTTGRGWEWRYLRINLTEEETNITLSLRAHINNSWVGACNFTLLTTADNIAINRATYQTALATAQAALNNANYSNVTGSEKTALQEAIATDVSANTEQVYDDATALLTSTTAAFIAAKASYDAYITAKAVVYVELPYAAAAKFEAITTAQNAAAATSATDADTKTAAIITAYRKYVESNALAEGVTGAEQIVISDPNMDVTYDSGSHTFGAWQVINQTNGTIKLLSGESFTDGDGNANYKYADIYKNDNNAGIEQIVNLEPGKYLFTATARAQATDGATFTIYAGNETANIQRIGNSGGVFGRGWNDASVEFSVTETKDVNIGVVSGNGKDLWWSATRFRLVKLADPVVISENSNNTIVASTNSVVALTRTIKADKWNSIVLPFALSNAELKAAFGDDVKIAEYSEAVNGDNSTISFTKMADNADAISANVPVLLKTSTAGTSYNFANRTIVAGTPTTDGTNFEFAGSYAASTYVTTGNYYISNNTLYRSGSDTGTFIKGTRAYIKAKGGSGARISGFFIDGEEATDIEGLTISTDEDGKLYNLQGQEVKKAKKGVFIKNGKKVVIK